MCKNYMSLALMVWDLWCFEDLEEKDGSLNLRMMEVFVERPRLHQVKNFKYKKKLCKALLNIFISWKVSQ